MLRAILVSVGVIRPGDSIKHQLLVLLLLLGATFHHHNIHILGRESLVKILLTHTNLVEQNSARHEQLGSILLNLPLLGRIL